MLSLPTQLAPRLHTYRIHIVYTMYHLCKWVSMFVHFIIVAFRMDCKLIVFGDVCMRQSMWIVYSYIHTILIFHLAHHIPFKKESMGAYLYDLHPIPCESRSRHRKKIKAIPTRNQDQREACWLVCVCGLRVRTEHTRTQIYLYDSFLWIWWNLLAALWFLLYM